jgi:5'-phosphate synthase pdxT subunit
MTSIGVLALQGDVREHIDAVHEAGATGLAVKSASQLTSIDALIIPGGESTTIAKLARIFGLFEPLKKVIGEGLPTFGTCAGLILLADRIVDGIEGQETFGGLDVTVQRNAFGHQSESFEATLDFVGIDEPKIAAAFIRAPIILQVGNQTQTLAELDDGRVVAVRQGNILGVSFHPEIVGESRVHEFFLNEFIKKA